MSFCSYFEPGRPISCSTCGPWTLPLSFVEGSPTALETHFECRDGVRSGDPGWSLPSQRNV